MAVKKKLGCRERPTQGGGNKKYKFGAPMVPQISGAFGTPNGFKNLTRSMRIPNMCLVLKSDNGKVVSIANEQNHRQTESCQHPVPYYYIDIIIIEKYGSCVFSYKRPLLYISDYLQVYLYNNTVLDGSVIL